MTWQMRWCNMNIIIIIINTMFQFLNIYRYRLKKKFNQVVYLFIYGIKWLVNKFDIVQQDIEPSWKM